MTFRFLCLLAAASCAATGLHAQQERGFFSRSGGSREPAPQVTAAQTEQARLVTQLQNIQITIDAVHAQQEAILREQAALGARVARLEQNAGKTETQEIIAIKRDIDTLRQNMAAQRPEIANEITGKISVMLAEREQQQQQRNAVKAQKPKPTGPGYSHTVERGQTLSEIARGYGKSVSEIMQANDLKDPSALRVGQILFIPDQKQP